MTVMLRRRERGGGGERHRERERERERETQRERERRERERSETFEDGGGYNQPPLAMGRWKEGRKECAKYPLHLKKRAD